MIDIDLYTDVECSSVNPCAFFRGRSSLSSKERSHLGENWIVGLGCQELNPQLESSVCLQSHGRFMHQQMTMFIQTCVSFNELFLFTIEHLQQFFITLHTMVPPPNWLAFTVSASHIYHTCKAYFEIQFNFSVIVVNILNDIPYHNAPVLFKRHIDGDDVR